MEEMSLLGYSISGRSLQFSKKYVGLLDIKPGIAYEVCSPTGRKQAHVVLN